MLPSFRPRRPRIARAVLAAPVPLPVLAFLAVLASLGSLAAPARAQCQDDPFEPNDDCASATPLVLPQELFGGAILGDLAPGGPSPDVFAVVVPPGETLEVRPGLYPPPPIRFEIFDDPSCTVPVAVGSASDFALRAVNTGATPADFRIALRQDPGGPPFDCMGYLFSAFSYLDPCPGLAADPFEPNDDLASAALLPPGSYTGLTVSVGDPDFYRIPAQPGQRIDLVLTPLLTGYPAAEPYVTFLDVVTGHVLPATTSGGGAWSYVNLTGHAEVGLRISVGGVFTCNGYDLDVGVSDTFCASLAPDAFEENDDCAAAASLPEGVFGGLGVDYVDRDFFRVGLAPGEAMVAIFEADAASPNAIDVDLMDAAACPGGSPWAVHSFGGRETAVVRNDSGVAHEYTFMVRVDLEDFDVDAPCAAYGVTLHRYASPIGQSYCPALPNSGGSPARLEVFGSPVVADGELALLATDLPLFAPGIFFFGPNQVQLPLGNGLRCVGGRSPSPACGAISSTSSTSPRPPPSPSSPARPGTSRPGSATGPPRTSRTR